MSFTVRPTYPSMRRSMTAVIVAALLGVAGVMATAPASASAASCDAGEFCMWYFPSHLGGLYEWGGWDWTLADDHFKNANTNSIVDNNTMSVWNRGVSDPNGRVHVVVHDGIGYTGAGLCVAQGRSADLPLGWYNRISSFHWVTTATCNLYPRL